jgi:predicted nuclease of predicted toxin-antitoxin system
MRVLLDECVPRGLRQQLPGHEVKTVAETGWAGAKNGELLRLAAQQFDVLLTVDRNFEYQQNLVNAPIAVIVMHVASNDIVALERLMPRVLAAIPGAKRGDVTKIK